MNARTAPGGSFSLTPLHYTCAMTRDAAKPRLVPPLSALEACATPIAVVDAALVVQSCNPALTEWLAGGLRRWRGESLATLDARPPTLADAAHRALAEQRRVHLRQGCLRTALGDRVVDIALTPLDAQALLVEVHPLATDSGGAHLSDSLRGFAHEVRGPLAGMRGAAQLLQRRVDLPELQELAALIVGEVDRLNALAERLLHSGAKPRLARLNIHEAVERVATLLAAQAQAPVIRRDYDPSLPAISANADRVQQALLNLGRNAIEAGATTLTLRTRAEHGARVGDRSLRLGVRIEVADDGHGVASDLRDTLFEPLVSGRADGSGLGLSLAREVAREHGGELTYASRPGATVFSLLLPAGE